MAIFVFSLFLLSPSFHLPFAYFCLILFPTTHRFASCYYLCYKLGGEFSSYANLYYADIHVASSLGPFPAYLYNNIEIWEWGGDKTVKLDIILYLTDAIGLLLTDVHGPAACSPSTTTAAATATKRGGFSPSPSSPLVYRTPLSALPLRCLP